MVASAKSWLCHAGVDRESPILPWGSPSKVPHLSPVQASTRYLSHLREAWNYDMSEGRDEWCMEQCDVVLTVPASFDEVARELTIRAAREAGLTKLTLLEEPQAAFYSWVRSQGTFWRDQEIHSFLRCLFYPFENPFFIGRDIMRDFHLKSRDFDHALLRV